LQQRTGPNIRTNEYVFSCADKKGCYLNIIIFSIFLITPVTVICCMSLPGDWLAFLPKSGVDQCSY
jgi:hypothetical protein